MSTAEFQNLRILIADDNDSDRQILQTIVKKQGHQVFAASDGIIAVKLFEEEKPDMVLMDALMPNMDGFEAARRIKAMCGEDIVPIIFLTSLKDASSLADCLDAGGDDFLTKPYNRVILQAKIQAFARMQRLHETVQTQRDEISTHIDHMVREQEVAKAVFDNIAHPGCIDAKNIKYLLSPMAVFNGDMVLAAKKPSGGMYVLLGDFTGHGLPAAIGAMPASETFYGMTKKGFTIEEILKEVNKKLKTILPVGVFCCCCMIDLDFRKSMAKAWIGGLPDIFIYRKETKSIQPISSRHLPLGVLSNEKFNTEIQVLELAEGDRIYLWSDGIHEAENPNGEMFGTERLVQIFKESANPENLFDDIKRGVEEFTQAEDQSDDYTIVEVVMVNHEELDESEAAPGKDVAKSGPQMDWVFTYQLRPPSLRTFNPLPLMTHILMEVPGLRPHSGQLYTILSELYSNALEHGLLGLSSELKHSAHGFADYYRQRTEQIEKLVEETVTIILDHKPTETGGELIISVKDDGPGFDFESKKDNEHRTEGYSGRGIPLIRTLCSSLTYHDRGNHVQVVYPWSYKN